ncbi:MAG TPA: phosphotransferase [Steroidobacteraceae bacterium]|nr:phosphotransferase [Steroidobacteraceae bacterium]
MDKITDAKYVSNFVGERLAAKGLLQSPVSLRRHRQAMEDADSKIVFLSKGRHGLVVVVSPALFPEVVAEEYLKAARMRSHLGDLGAPILEPLDSGRIGTLSYAVLPYRRPLARRRGLRWIDRKWMKRYVREWLLQLAQRRSTHCSLTRYEASLTALGRTVAADSVTAALLRSAEKYLRSGRFAPRACPMHGDLWGGNVLHGAASTAFTLVDWRGSEIDGFPLFDLIRTAQSFGFSAKALYRELQLHRAALGCQPEDLPVYLLGALGHYAAHLGEMAPRLFRDMADECVRHLSLALDSAARSGSVQRLQDGPARSAAFDGLPPASAPESSSGK